MKIPVVLKNKNYVKLLAGMSISKLGDSFFLIALPLLVYELTKSPSLMAFGYVLEILPMVLFSLFGGALADQMSKKKIMVIGDITSSLLIVTVPLAYSFGVLEVWMVYVVIFCIASVSAFYHPCFESVVPEVLQNDNLVQGNSLFKFVETITTFTGPSIAGVMVALLGTANVLYVDSLSFVLSAMFVSMVTLHKVEKKSGMPAIVQPIKEGLRYVFRTKIIWLGTLFIFLINVGYGAVEALFMFYLKGHLKLPAPEIGIIFSCQMAGSFLAIYLANRMKHIPRGNLMIYAGFAIGVGQVMLVVSQSFVIGLVLCRMVILGSTTLLAINWFTLRQEVVPKELLGRVISSTRMVSFLAVPFSGMIAGVTAEYVSVGVVFLTSGIFVLFFSLITLRTMLHKRIGKTDEPFSRKGEVGSL
ncbi:Transmembrane secretion effector [Marininema mesophilum]|uniref:Transmembrane secretion effector n=1 Tax=Marininema mesophilum TaxID=1048340 RepID=A0A1H3B2U2_9BACL|nr:MFS transporter [Marininema mesophilum]SDX35981.1 Transmembrane secretion effector [Marininema mesophilum]